MIRIIEETGSTNADLIERLRAGEHIAEGDWLVARRQTAGRGRQGREWLDGSGNFLGSSVVHRAPGDPPAPTLALASGLAVYEALLPWCPDPARLMLKWPNDVLLGHAKISGILLEAVGHGTRQSIVIGIGVNLAVAPQLPDRETIALAQVTKPPALEAFAERLAHCLDGELQRWREFGLDLLIRRWCACAHPLGTPLAVHDGDAGVIRGTFGGLSDEGSLLLRLADGQTRAIHAGDVSLD